MAVTTQVSSSSRADRLIRDQKQHEKVVQLWTFLGCVLGFLTLINVLCTLRPYLRKRSSVAPAQRGTGADKEKLASGPTPSVWSRSIAALATTYRVIAFRHFLPIGFGTHMLFSETVFICIYMASLLIWLLVDSMSVSRYYVVLQLTKNTLARDLTVMFYEDRAAHLASCQLPLIVALAGKNNIVSCK